MNKVEAFVLDLICEVCRNSQFQKRTLFISLKDVRSIHLHINRSV